jgi:hypothetical protein
VLPESYDNLPHFFTAGESKFLEGTLALKSTEESTARTKTSYDLILNAIPDFENLYGSFHQYHTFFHHVNNRVFFMPIRDEATLVLVPLLDSLNHENQPGAKLYHTFNNKHDMLGILGTNFCFKKSL